MNVNDVWTLALGTRIPGTVLAKCSAADIQRAVDLVQRARACDCAGHAAMVLSMGTCAVFVYPLWQDA